MIDIDTLVRRLSFASLSPMTVEFFFKAYGPLKSGLKGHFCYFVQDSATVTFFYLVLRCTGTLTPLGAYLPRPGAGLSHRSS